MVRISVGVRVNGRTHVLVIDISGGTKKLSIVYIYIYNTYICRVVFCVQAVLPGSEIIGYQEAVPSYAGYFLAQFNRGLDIMNQAVSSPESLQQPGARENVAYLTNTERRYKLIIQENVKLYILP